MTKTAQERATEKYMKNTKKPQVVLNLNNEDERKIFDAVANDDMKFSERCKMLLKQYYDIA